MKWEMQETLFKQMCVEESRILVQKGREYASKDDSLANFKRGKRVGISPFQRWWTFAEKHWNAIETFIEEGTTFSEETIVGRINDARNYLFLLHCLIVDNEYPQADEMPELVETPRCTHCAAEMNLTIEDNGPGHSAGTYHWTCDHPNLCPKCGNMMALSPNTGEMICQMCMRKEND